MNLKFTIGLLLSTLTFSVFSQAPSADTVIIPLAETSKIIFTIEDRSDIEILKHYDFQGLFEDILKKLEDADTLAPDSADRETIARKEPEENWNTQSDDQDDNDDDDTYGDDGNKWERSRWGKIGQTWQSTNVDFGTNNFQTEDNHSPMAVNPMLCGHGVPGTSV